MKRRRDPFQAIADPTRRAIIILLAANTMTAGAIASEFDAARPTISKHIRVLSQCDLIKANQKGREIFYELKIEKIDEIDKWLEQLRKIWETRFHQLDNLLSKIKTKTK